MAVHADKLEKLESVRGLAAFYVFVHHYVHCNDALAMLRPIFIFGQTAVMVFMILSGFVIYYSTMGRDAKFSVRSFLVRRFRRIFPAFTLALLLGWIIASLAQHTWADPDWKNLVGNLLMLQDKQHSHVWFLPYLGNSSLWTLSYEWWFYMLFLPVWYLARNHPNRGKYWASGVAVLGFVTYFVAPNQFSIIAAYFMIWWSGAEFAQEYIQTGRVTFRRQAYSIAMLAAMSSAWAAVCYWQYLRTGSASRADFPFLQLQHQGTVLMLVLAAIAWHKLRFFGFRYTIGPFKHVAPVSYALYIFHVPIVLYAAQLQVTGSVWLDFLWVCPLVLGLSWLVEVPLQQQVNRWIR